MAVSSELRSSAISRRKEVWPPTALPTENWKPPFSLGQVKIVAFDEDPATLGGAKDGTIVGTIVQQAYEWGYLSMTALAKYIEGKKSVTPADGRITLPTRIIDKDNVDAYWTVEGHVVLLAYCARDEPLTGL